MAFKEELKMEFETKKILGKKINLTSTCVRNPEYFSFESINVEFVKSTS